ncbi:MAG: zinc transporter ZupT, partial [Thermoplasmata archaeon]
MSDVAFAFLLTLLAGLSTTLGAALAFVIKNPGKYFLAFSLGFSGGVMLYISFVELFPHAVESVGEAKAILAFFIGIAFIALIDLAIPEADNPHHFQRVEKDRHGNARNRRKVTAPMRTGMFIALAITIHNFPEGIATFASALTDANLGIVIAIAIALHNIPEGISVSVPIYYATGSRATAFKYSFISGIAEPMGAAVAYLVLMPFLSDELLSMSLAFVAGIMVYISVDEIIPAAYS